MPFKPGQSGNPRGRPPILDPALKKQAEQDKNNLRAAILEYVKYTEAELRAIEENIVLPLWERTLAKDLLRSLTAGSLPKDLYQIAVGQLVDKDDLTSDERLLLSIYREKRDAFAQAQSFSQALPADAGSAERIEPPAGDDSGSKV